MRRMMHALSVAALLASAPVAQAEVVLLRGAMTCTGFFVAPDIAITNAHCVGSHSEVAIGQRMARVLVVDANADVAVVRANAGLARVFALREDLPVTGEPVTLIGYPGGRERAESRGQVLFSAKLDNGAPVLVHSAQSEPGYSGGPILDSEGKVLGVHFGRHRADGRGFAAPASVILEAIERAR